MRASTLLNPELLTILAAGMLFSSCSSVRPPTPTRTSQRPVESEPARPVLDKPLVADMFAACGIVVEDLIGSEILQNAERPLVIEISAIENATGAAIDCKIYPEIIRSKIIESRCPKIVFRDEKARSQVVRERINQMDQDYSVTEKSESIKKTKRVRTGPPRDGQLMEDASPVERDTAIEKENITKTRSGTVSGKVADVDYFLNGKLYSQNELEAGARDVGMRFFLFEFHLTDSRTSLIPWAKTYRVKREGVLTK